MALISTKRQQLRIYKELASLTYKHLHKASRNVYFVSVVNMNSFYFYNNKNLSDMHYKNYICHTAAFQRGLQGFLAMNRLKVCTLLSFMEQLKNTGPPISTACVQEFCKSKINIPNEYAWSMIQKSMHAKIPILANFHSITQYFATKKIGIFQVKFVTFPSVKFPKICWTIKHICVLPSACQ